MVATQSTMLALGTAAPDFALADTDGQTKTLQDYANQPLLVMFICNHCPFVKHVAPELARLSQDYATQLGMVAIMSNDVANYPADAPELMKEEALAQGYDFAYLYDATQDVAKAYTAACTPDFFLFDAQHKLYYRGQLDDSRPRKRPDGSRDFETDPATGADLRQAIDALLANQPATLEQKPSMGCNIKWKPGQAPAYFTA